MYNRLFFSFLVLALFLTSCSDKTPSILSFAGFTQGTTYSIIYDNNINITPDILRGEVEEILSDFDMSLSLYIDSSIICRLNRNEDVLPDFYFLDVFKKSAYISKISSGAFDVTVGPLVKAWGFGPDSHKNFSEAKRDSMMKLIGMDKVSIVNGRLIKSDPSVSLDFNAIAQGYSVDVVCLYFDKKGIRNYLIEIGGEVRAKGTKAGAHWRIGIDKPVDNNLSPGETLQAIIRISDKALATSGNYRKFYVEDGVKYSHTIDPRTGYPAKNRLLSATIIADECAVADGVATACMVMGKEGAIEFVNKHPEFSAYLVFSDDNGNFQTWISESLKEYITETGE